MFVKTVASCQLTIVGGPKGFFKCPKCGNFKLLEKKDHLECLDCRSKWEFKDGIYDFREAIGQGEK